MADLRHVDLLGLVQHDVQLRRVARTDGGEWAGPCPACGGDDRFRVWPSPASGNPRYWCRQCDAKGDAVDYLRWRNPNMSYTDAFRALNVPPSASKRSTPPPPRPRPLKPTGEAQNDTYQQRAMDFVLDCVAALWASDAGAKAAAWLKARGLTEDTLEAVLMGFNPTDRHEPGAAWGMPNREKVFLPRGVVIPWLDVHDGLIHRINVRRATGKPKYLSVAGYDNWLYGPYGRALAGETVVMVEGEFDALSIAQATNSAVACVATGSTGGARTLHWLATLSGAARVLVAFDDDDAGAKAAVWWLERLENAKRLRPTSHDANQMLIDGTDIKSWLAGAKPAARGPDQEHAEQMTLIDVPETEKYEWVNHPAYDRIQKG